MQNVFVKRNQVQASLVLMNLFVLMLAARKVFIVMQNVFVRNEVWARLAMLILVHRFVK